MIRVYDSSSIACSKYENNNLTILFNNGGIYQYDNVPKDKVDKLAAAESVGGYFYRHIRDNYRCKKVKDF